jgi:hypothetical protein
MRRTPGQGALGAGVDVGLGLVAAGEAVVVIGLADQAAGDETYWPLVAWARLGERAAAGGLGRGGAGDGQGGHGGGDEQTHEDFPRNRYWSEIGQRRG